MKILIVDDEPAVREILRMWCEGEGYSVLEAENGEKGVKSHQREPADIMICDLIMPVQEGIETITYFRKHFPGVGIIAISGGGKIGPDSYLEVAQQLGAWKTFRKPIDMLSLMSALKEWREMKKLE